MYTQTPETSIHLSSSFMRAHRVHHKHRMRTAALLVVPRIRRSARLGSLQQQLAHFLCASYFDHPQM